jgi:quercetin dioxygenase-like cupin family protein
MARAGDVIENPTTGERITFARTVSDTQGELLAFEYLVPPRTPGPPLHVHPYQEERFVEVLSGVLNARLGNDERRIGNGVTFTVSPGTPHTWRNEGTEEVRMLVEIRPAMRMEEVFETTFALARDGKTDARGVPTNPPQAAVTAREYSDELRLAQPPFAGQRVLLGLLAPVCRLLGYHAATRSAGFPSRGSPGDEGCARVLRAWR